jgi:hypothetical protein
MADTFCGYHRTRTRIICLAQVALGVGFGAAAVRAVPAGINLFARQGYPTQVFAGVAGRFSELVATS